MTICYKAAKS